MTDRRLPYPVFAALLAALILAAAPGPIQGQTSPPAGPSHDDLHRRMLRTIVPRTDSLVQPWDGACRHPAEHPETRTAGVFLALESAHAYRKLPPLLLSYIAQDLAGPLARVAREDDGRIRLLSADSLYPARVLLSRGTVTLTRDGTFSGLDLSQVVHDGFREALRASFESIAARGGVGGFDAEGLPPEMPLVLRLETAIDTTIGLAPLFTLEIPVDRPAMLLPDNRPPSYPKEARSLGAEAYVLLTFIVDIDGSVREETIRSLPAGRPMSRELSRVFDAFERAARASALRYEYRPAEFMGCRVQMWVQQPFTFRLSR